MKKTTLIVIVALVFNVISCEENMKAPQEVKDAFAAKFSTATDVEWDRDSDSEWEAEFKKDGKEYLANFLEDGSWTETEYVINLSDVPSNVMEVLNAEFAGYNIEDIEFSETPKGIAYEFSIENEEENLEVAIDASGNIIKKEHKKHNDEDEDDD